LERGLGGIQVLSYNDCWKFFGKLLEEVFTYFDWGIFIEIGFGRNFGSLIDYFVFNVGENSHYL
jgi:hypothetical protein